MKNNLYMGDKKVYICTNCGYSKNNRYDWCDLGCGNDYNEMVEVGERGIKQIKNQIEWKINKIDKEIDQEFKNTNGTEYTNGFEDAIDKVRECLKQIYDF